MKMTSERMKMTRDTSGYEAVSANWGSRFFWVSRAPLFWLVIGAPGFWKLSHQVPKAMGSDLQAFIVHVLADDYNSNATWFQLYGMFCLQKGKNVIWCHGSCDLGIVTQAIRA